MVVRATSQSIGLVLIPQTSHTKDYTSNIYKPSARPSAKREMLRVKNKHVFAGQVFLILKMFFIAWGLVC